MTTKVQCTYLEYGLHGIRWWQIHELIEAIVVSIFTHEPLHVVLPLLAICSQVVVELRREVVDEDTSTIALLSLESPLNHPFELPQPSKPPNKNLP